MYNIVEMRLSLRGFKQFSNAVFEFVEGKSNYLSGNSGEGKSTVFQAIVWVLYGKIKGVCNWRSPGSKASVELSTGKMIIYRQCNTKLLRVTDSLGTLEGDEAQELINREYGTKDMFMFSSYTQQGELHPFIEAPSAKRFSILTSIGTTEDPEAFISNTVASIQRTKREHESMLDDYRRLSSKYKEMYTDIEYSWLLSSDTLASYQSKIDDNRQKVRESHGELLTSTELESKKLLLAKIFAEKEAVLSDYLLYSRQELETLERRQRNYASYSVYLKRKNEIVSSLEAKRAALGSLGGRTVSGTYSKRDVTAARESTEKHATGKAVCRSVGIEYTNISVENKIDELTLLLESQDAADKYERRSLLLSEKEKIVSSLPPVPSISYEQAAQNMSRARELYTSSKVELESEKNSLLTELTRLYNERKNELASRANANIEAIRSSFSERLREINKERESSLSRLADALTASEKELSRIESSRTIHSCPHCSGPIRINGDSLEASTQSAFDEASHKRSLSDVNMLKSRIEQEKSESDRKSLHERDQITVSSEIVARKTDEDIALLTREHKDSCEMILADFDKRGSAIDESFVAKQRENEEVTRAYHTIARLKGDILKLDQSVAAIPITVTEWKRLSPKELVNAKDSLAALKGISVVEEPPVSPDEMERSIKWHTINNSVLSLEKQLQSLPFVEEEREVTIDLEDYREKVILREQFVKERDSLRRNLASYPEFRPTREIEREIRMYTEETSHMKDAVAKSERARILTEYYEDLVSKRKALDATHTNLVKLNELKEDAGVATGRLLQSTVNRINAFIAPNANKLFSDPITIEVTTSKCVKSSGIDKPRVGMRIRYKGGEFDNPRQLSGGECTKVSVLLSMAFARCYDSSILILDELASHLDSDNKDNLLELVSECVPSTTLLIACHESHTGNYDNIIKVTERGGVPEGANK